MRTRAPNCEFAITVCLGEGVLQARAVAQVVEVLRQVRQIVHCAFVQIAGRHASGYTHIVRQKSSD